MPIPDQPATSLPFYRHTATKPHIHHRPPSPPVVCQVRIRVLSFPSVTPSIGLAGTGIAIAHHPAMLVLCLNLLAGLRSILWTRTDPAIENLALRQQNWCEAVALLHTPTDAESSWDMRGPLSH